MAGLRLMRRSCYALAVAKNVIGWKKCLACGKGYEPTSSRQRVCFTCTPDKSWQARYRRYGITKPLFEQMMEEQSGLCPLCLEELKLDLNTCIDHCHNELYIRGILCRGCNMVLGRIEDSRYMDRARAYLELGGFDRCVSET